MRIPAPPSAWSFPRSSTPQEIFQASYDAIPADDPFWAVVIGDSGVKLLFDNNAVYLGGSMTLQALRNEVGDEAFWGPQAGGRLRGGLGA